MLQTETDLEQYQTGAGTSMSRIGWADLGLTTMNEMTDNAAMITALAPLTPLITDIDSGYGGPLMVDRTVKRLIRARVAGFHLEDQPTSKRCGHLFGKEVVSREQWYMQLRAAVNARREAGEDIVIIARTDARQPLGFDEVLERVKGAISIGVDAVFPEALHSKEEARMVCEAVAPVPVLLNMVQNGVTPNISVGEARDIGFKMVIYPSVCLRGAISGMRQSMTHLKTHGTQETSAEQTTPKDAFLLCGMADCVKIDREAGGSAFRDL